LGERRFIAVQAFQGIPHSARLIRGHLYASRIEHCGGIRTDTAGDEKIHLSVREAFRGLYTRTAHCAAVGRIVDDLKEPLV